MSTLSAAPLALTILSEEEAMFRDAVREFAETEVAPHVSAMDEAAQFRGELFNIFNTPQFGRPGTVFGNPTFGVVSNQANTPRQIQLGLKLLF